MGNLHGVSDRDGRTLWVNCEALGSKAISRQVTISYLYSVT